MPFNKSDEIREELGRLEEQARAVVKSAQAEERELTVEEEQLIDANLRDGEQLNEKLERLESLESFSTRLSQPRGRKTDPADVDVDASPQRLTKRVVRTAMGPDGQPVEESLNVQPHSTGLQRSTFGHLGELAQSAAYFEMKRGADPRLRSLAPTTWGSEGVGGDGGFAVPPDFRSAIMSLVGDETALLSRTDQYSTPSNAITFPKDETTPWGTSGIQAYWGSEAGQMTQSKPALEQNEVKLNKVYVLVPVTEELLDDAPALGQYLTRKVAQVLDFKISLSIFQGTGAGQPLGLLNSGSVISVAKESGQSADTIVFNNIIKMWSRLYGPSQMNAVWLHNQDIFPQLATMSFEGTSSSVPAYMPAGGLSGAPFASLMGRPAITHQVCETLGDKGDIMLVDLSSYMTATKGGGVRQDTSMHLFFDYDMIAFRFVMRVGGQPWFTSAISPRDGTNSLSPYVTLAERA